MGPDGDEKFLFDQHRQHRRSPVQLCRFTDGGGSTLFARGFSTRILTATRLSVALLDHHVRQLDSQLTAHYRSSITNSARLHWAKAGLANLCLWLGWLRSMETFNLRWYDFVVIEPGNSLTVDLAPGVDMVLLKLSDETKSLRTKKADMVITYETLSGYQLARWYHRVRHLSGVPVDPATDLRPIFTTRAGTPWTSRFFRYEYLYPSLALKRTQDDAFLNAFDDSVGNTIPDKFWLLHSIDGVANHMCRVAYNRAVCARRMGQKCTHMDDGGVNGATKPLTLCTANGPSLIRSSSPFICNEPAAAVGGEES